MKKIRKAVLSLVLAATMTVSSVPVMANAKTLDTMTFCDDDGTKHEYPILSAENMEMDELIAKMEKEIPVAGGYKMTYENIFDGTLTAENSSFNYEYMFLSKEDETVYTIDMLIYYVTDENGNKAFAVKFPQSEEYYLFKITAVSEGRKEKLIDENNVEHDITRILIEDLPVDELIKRIGDINVNDWIFTYSGKYNGEITESTYNFNNSYTEYSRESEILYSVYYTIYSVRTDSGEKAYAIKFRNYPDYYLYTVTEQCKEDMKKMEDNAKKDEFAPQVPPFAWYEIPELSETAGTTYNYFEGRKYNDVPLDNTSIEEVTDIIGDITVLGKDEYKLDSKYNGEVDLGNGFQYYEFTDYKYDYDTKTLYNVHMVARMIQLENGEEAYLIKMDRNKKDNSFYLYRLSKKSDTELSENSKQILDELRKNIIVIGDANCDTDVNMADSVLIMQSLANPDKYELTPHGIENADTDGNGITNADALNIQKQLLVL